MKYLLNCMLAMASILVAGCAPGEPFDVFIPIEDGPIPVRIPYAEEVVIQEPVYAGEEISVSVRVSSVLDPQLLQGDPFNKLGA